MDGVRCCVPVCWWRSHEMSRVEASKQRIIERENKLKTRKEEIAKKLNTTYSNSKHQEAIDLLCMINKCRRERLRLGWEWMDVYIEQE